MHHILQRQLKKLGLTESEIPKDDTQWQALLAHVDIAYKQSDEDIYSLKQSGDIAYKEMKELSKLASFSNDNIDPVMRFDRKKNLVYANSPAKKILDKLEIDRENKATGELLEIINAALSQHTQVTQELKINDRFFLIRFVSIFDNATSNEKSVNVYATDITVQKEFEKKLIAAKDMAIQSNKSKSEFLAMMSHEIRTPMNGVMGMSELLLTTSLEKKQQRYANNIIKSSQALLRIIDDILDISKIDANKLDLELKNFNVIEFIHEFSEIFLVPLTEKNLALNANIDSTTPTFIHADAIRLRQILINLIGNAIKFTSEGVIQLNLRMTTEDEQTNTLLFEVIDQGIGIDAAMRKEIFESFTQADQSTTRLYGGTGLGLTIAKRLVYMMQGEIGVDSEPGQGSRFWFTVCLQKNIIEQEEKLTKLHVQKDAQIKKERMKDTGRVLLAEDNILNQEVATDMLELLGYKVDIADNGKQAVDAIKDNKYIMIFMDCQMPEMDGYEATQAIRQFEENISSNTPTPIIAITANAMSSDAEKCKQAGMDDFLPKPFSLKDLESVISTYQ